MQVQAADLALFSSGGKAVQLVTPDWYNAKYKNVRRLEHGHAADMFNAPDPAPDTIAGYPLGFFITRLAASAEDQSALWQALKKLLQQLGATQASLGAAAARAPSAGAFFVEAIIGLLQTLAEVPDSAPIRFTDPAIDGKYTVADVKSHYNSLFLTWLLRYPRNLVNTMLASLVSNGLDWYASILLNQSTPPKLVVMGHTHHGEVEGDYDNSGCWCIPSALGHGDATPHYVSIIGETATLVPWNSKLMHAGTGA